MRPVAIIERNPARSGPMIAAFEAAGFRTAAYRTAAAVLPALRMHTFSLVLLGLDVEDTDPFAFCHELSRILPVITILAEHDETLCVRALDCGADDCIARSIGGRELVARAQSVLRRASRHGEGNDDLSVAVREMRVRKGTAIEELSRGETEILALLLEHAPAPLTALEIATRLNAKRGTVDSRMKKLRRKLGARLVSRGHYGYCVE